VVTLRTLFGGQLLGGTGYLAGEILVFWLAGVFVRDRRQAAALAARNAALQRYENGIVRPGHRERT
jgi:uncharacterized membrane protein YdjX (TVP38/TMEM64 family)